jgi:hypothetical protein
MQAFCTIFPLREILQQPRDNQILDIYYIYKYHLCDKYITPDLTYTRHFIIFILKIFDVVWVMTGGQFGTDVIATQFYQQSFINYNSGFGSAIAIVLLVAVIPVMIYNLRQMKEQETFR